MTDAEGPVYKQCPDCAEQVLAAARKCRYCGYRFDSRRRRGGSALADLLGGLHKDTSDVTFEEVLADWGTSLGEGEVVEWFRLSEVDEHLGYLLVTSERLVFYTQTSRTTHERAFEYPLTLLSDVRLSGRGRSADSSCASEPSATRCEGPRAADLDRLNDYLEHVLTENHPVPTQPPAD